MRGSKAVNGTKTIYQYVGDKLYYEKRGDNQEFYYFYDGFGNLSTIYYTFGDSRAIYYVTTNMQGDVNAIYNSSGALVARYEYDAWGNTLSVTDANGNPITAWYNIANANPIRYRGYYYDKDLDLHYLQSRYYDSNTGRFLNADGFVTTGQGVLSYNMFAYCLNNPVNMYDGLGTFPLETAFKFLFNWVFGNGEKKEYNDKSRISKKLKDSSKMQGKVDEAIDNYKQGQSTTVGVGEFTAAEDGYELYLSTQHFKYSIVVEEETRSNGILFWKHEESRYVATVTVSDTYNFDKRRGWNSFGNIMNDIAYEYDQYIGGNDFEWCATYKYSTKWKDND